MRTVFIPGKLTVAWTGALVATAAWTMWGYFSLNQAAREPGYEPPNATHLALVSPRASAMVVLKCARSANAWRLLRKRRLSVLRSLNKGEIKRTEFHWCIFLTGLSWECRAPSSGRSVGKFYCCWNSSENKCVLCTLVIQVKWLTFANIIKPFKSGW